MKILLYLALFISAHAIAQVGINTTAPTASLDIDGDLRIRNVPVETIMEVAQDSVLVISRDGRVKTISATEITESAMASNVKGKFSSMGLIGVSLSTGPATIPFNSEEWDANDEFDTSTNTFTAKQDGIYEVNLQLEADGTLGVAANFGVLILKNGVVESRNSYPNVGVAGVNVTPPVRRAEVLVQMITGDTISYQLEGDLALGTVSLIGDDRDSFFTIHKVR